MSGADGKDVNCAFCATTVLGQAFVICERCEIPIHRDCWDSQPKCPAYACGSTSIRDPAVHIFRTATPAALIDPAVAPIPRPDHEGAVVTVRQQIAHLESRQAKYRSLMAKSYAGALAMLLSLLAGSSSEALIAVSVLVFIASGAWISYCVSQVPAGENDAQVLIHDKLVELRKRELLAEIGEDKKPRR